MRSTDTGAARWPDAARDGDPVALASALVSIPSVNPVLEPGGAGERRIAEACAGLLGAWGMTPRLEEVAPGRPNVVARLRGTGSTLLLNGHLDTVGVQGMRVPPFDAARDGARLVGRGACDMKGGVAALLAAAHRLARGRPEARPHLIVALTADEEHASLGMARLVEQVRDADMAVVCEPTSLSVMPAHKGFVWIRATFEGRAAHGSRPDVGVDAIRHAGLYLARLERLHVALGEAPGHPLLGRPSFHAGTIRGGRAESVYPDRCELLLEQRTLPGERAEDVLAAFEAELAALATSVPELDARLDVTLARPGTETPSGSRVATGLREALERSGKPAPLRGMSAWVDAAYLNEAGIPSVCFGPGDIEQAHTDDEWIDVREIVTATEVLTRFARSLATR